MNVIHFLIFAILIKLNFDDILSKSCKLVDFCILAALVLYLRREDFIMLKMNPDFLFYLVVLTYFLPLVLAASYCVFPFIRSNLGAGDILYLFAVAPLVPGIAGIRLLFVASLLALPFALLNYCRQKRLFETEAFDYFFPFIPFLTIATFFINP